MDKKNRKLSIISITKDDFEGINKTISSISSLFDYTTVGQYIVDSSNELISNKIKSISNSKNNIEYYKVPPSGISNAFNYGIDNVKGDWLWFLNGGDELLSQENGELMLRVIEKSSADIVIFKTAYGDSLTEREFPPMWLQWPPISSWIPHPSMIIRKKLFDKYGKFNPKYKGVMDFDLWLKMTSGDTKIDIISIPLVKFDVNGYSSTQGKLIAKECLHSIHSNLLRVLKTTTIKKKLFIKDYFSLIKKAYL